MQVSIETTEGLERKMTVAIPQEQVDSAVMARLQEASHNVNLNGFRKGKVPMKVIKNRFGKGVRQEVIGELVNKSYFDALSQENVKPAGQPRIEPTQMDEGSDVEFVATFEVYPEVIVPDFSTLKAERETATVSEDDIDKMIETLRSQRQTWQEVDRECKEGDKVNIDFVGTRDGEAFEGGSAQGTDLVLGSGGMIAGFEDGIVGCKAGDTTTLPLTFPEDYQAAELAGAAVEFAITVNTVNEQFLPAVDEEFFKSFGVEEGGLAAFREEVSGNMERELKTASRNKLKNQIMDAVVDAVDLAVPQGLMDQEIDQLRNQALQQMGGGQGIDPSMLPAELFQENASRRVVLGLVLGEVVKEQNLTADPVKVREAIEEIASTYESPEEVVNWYYGNAEQLNAVESSVVEDQVFDYIIEQADIMDKQLSYEEVIKPAAPKTAEPQADDDIVAASDEDAVVDAPEQPTDKEES